MPICRNCHRQFVENPQFIDTPLLDRISLAGIARVTQISQPCLQNYVNHKYQTVQRKEKVVITSLALPNCKPISIMKADE